MNDEYVASLLGLVLGLLLAIVLMPTFMAVREIRLSSRHWFFRLGLSVLMFLLPIIAPIIYLRAYGSSDVPLLCRLGRHKWHRDVIGQGRDARYMVRCRRCEKYLIEGD
jgi:hypothetical protein